MAEFGIESFVHRTFVGGPAMPRNDELRRVLQQNPNLLGDRAANDTECLSIFYGTKLSFKQVLLNLQQLIHFEDNFEAVLYARHNILRSEAEVDHALNLGFYDYTIEVLQHCNKLYYEHRAQERNRLAVPDTEDRVPREAVTGSFLADLLVKNRATLPFDHTVMKLQTPEDFQPPLLFKPVGYEEMLWTVAADHLDLEALDVTITHTFERPSDILRYLGVKVPDIPQAAVRGSPGNYGAEEEEEELIPYENRADDIADPVDFDNDAYNDSVGDAPTPPRLSPTRDQTPRGTPDGSLADGSVPRLSPTREQTPRGTPDGSLADGSVPRLSPNCEQTPRSSLHSSTASTESMPQLSPAREQASPDREQQQQGQPRNTRTEIKNTMRRKYEDAMEDCVREGQMCAGHMESFAAGEQDTDHLEKGPKTGCECIAVINEDGDTCDKHLHKQCRDHRINLYNMYYKPHGQNASQQSQASTSGTTRSQRRQITLPSVNTRTLGNLCYEHSILEAMKHCNDRSVITARTAFNRQHLVPLSPFLNEEEEEGPDGNESVQDPPFHM